MADSSSQCLRSLKFGYDLPMSDDNMSSNGDVTSGSPGRSATGVGSIETAILAHLRADGRVSIAELAKRLGISRAAAYSKVSALQQQGVITGYTAVVDPHQVGLGLCALVFVTVRPQTWASFRVKVADMVQVEYCAVTTGEHDAMMMIRSVDIGEVHAFVTTTIASMPEVVRTETVVVLDEVVRRSFLLPHERATGEVSGLPVGMTRFIPTSLAHAGMMGAGQGGTEGDGAGEEPNRERLSRRTGADRARLNRR